MELSVLLAEHGLERLTPVLFAEELTLSTLKWMARDPEQSFAESMAELEMDSSSAEQLRKALLATEGLSTKAPRRASNAEPPRATSSLPAAGATPPAQAPTPAEIEHDWQLPGSATAVKAAPKDIDETAAQAAFVPGWTPDGPRMVPVSSVGYNTDVLATLASHSKSRAPEIAPEIASPRSDQGAVQTEMLTALAAVATLSAREVAARCGGGPTTPKVKSFTQINHVSDASARVSTVKNSALDAYKRRLVADPHAVKGGGLLHLDRGTMKIPEAQTPDHRTSCEQRKAEPDELERLNRMSIGRWEQL